MTSEDQNKKLFEKMYIQPERWLSIVLKSTTSKTWNDINDNVVSQIMVKYKCFIDRIKEAKFIFWSTFAIGANASLVKFCNNLTDEQNNNIHHGFFELIYYFINNLFTNFRYLVNLFEVYDENENKFENLDRAFIWRIIAPLLAEERRNIIIYKIAIPLRNMTEDFKKDDCTLQNLISALKEIDFDNCRYIYSFAPYVKKEIVEYAPNGIKKLIEYQKQNIEEINSLQNLINDLIVNSRLDFFLNKMIKHQTRITTEKSQLSIPIKTLLELFYMLVIQVWLVTSTYFLGVGPIQISGDKTKYEKHPYLRFAANNKIYFNLDNIFSKDGWEITHSRIFSDLINALVNKFSR